MKSEILSTVFWLQKQTSTRLEAVVLESLKHYLLSRIGLRSRQPFPTEEEGIGICLSLSQVCKGHLRSLTSAGDTGPANGVKTSIPIVCLGRIQMFDFLNCISVIPNLGCTF